MYVDDEKCGASHTYWNGCGGFGNKYDDSYFVYFNTTDATLGAAEKRACLKVMNEVCRYFGV